MYSVLHDLRVAQDGSHCLYRGIQCAKHAALQCCMIAALCVCVGIAVLGMTSLTAQSAWAATDISSATVKLKQATVTYSGTTQTPEVEYVKVGDVFLQVTDYSVDAPSAKSAGTYNVIVTGTGVYTGSAQTTFKVDPAPMSSAVLTLSQKSYVYDRTAKKPSVYATFKGSTLSNGADYSVSYAAGRKDVGTYAVTLTGKGNFSGSTSVSFSIASAPIKNATISGLDAVTYDRAAHAMEPKLKYTFGSSTITLKKGTAYVVSYLDSAKAPIKAGKIKPAGAYYVKIDGMGNYGGSITKKFRIKKAHISTADIAGVTNVAYTGKKQTQNPTVKYQGKKQKPKVAYKLSYLNYAKKPLKASQVKAVGTYYVKIAGMGNFKGSVVKKFLITRANIKDATVQNVLTKVYNGKKQKQKPVVTINGIKLKKGRDYNVRYKRNRKAGTARMIIVGMGNYRGKKVCTFTINPASVSSAYVSPVETQRYTGNPVTPKPNVTLGGRTLKLGKDYTLGYRNNKNAGTATIIVLGKGNYNGSKQATFTISKSLVRSTTLSSGTVFVGNEGSTFHRIGCKQLKTIARTYASRQSALDAGYTACSSCKP